MEEPTPGGEDDRRGVGSSEATTGAREVRGRKRHSLADTEKCDVLTPVLRAVRAEQRSSKQSEIERAMTHDRRPTKHRWGYNSRQRNGAHVESPAWVHPRRK